MAGPIDLDPNIEYDYEPGYDGPETAYASGWEVTMSPNSFGCNVCRLTLDGMQELAEGGLPSFTIQIDPDDLGPDFNPDLEAERLYGIGD